MTLGVTSCKLFFFVVMRGGKIENDRLYATKGTRVVFLRYKYLEVHFKRIIDKKPAYKRFPYPQDKLDRLCGLNKANLPGHNSQNAYLASCGGEFSGWRCGPHTPQTGPPLFEIEKACLPFKPNRCTEYIGLFCKKACIIDEIFGREIIRTIEDKIKLAYQF